MDVHELIESLTYAFLAFAVGVLFLTLAIRLLPKWVDKITPNIDETKEILEGNQAVGQYYGLVVGASILSVGIIVAAAIIAGLH